LLKLPFDVPQEALYRTEYGRAMGLLPSRVFAEPDPGGPLVLDIDGTDADRAFDALSSGTARSILAAIYDEPRTPTEVREEVGTSLQNVHYHLEKLEDAELIEPAGTGYSEKGNEMTVYAPASEAVVLFAGHDHDRSRLEGLLGRLVALYLVLAVATISLKVALDQLRPEPSPETFTARSGGYETSDAGDAGAGGADGGGAGAPGGDGATTGGVADGPVDLVVDAVVGMDPALAFFLGGAITIAALGVIWYVRGR
jgi:DNA-binding transcriptional ArsR family regulator